MSIFGHLPTTHQAQRSLFLAVEDSGVALLVRMTMLVKNKPLKEQTPPGLLRLKAVDANESFTSAKI